MNIHFPIDLPLTTGELFCLLVGAVLAFFIAYMFGNEKTDKTFVRNGALAVALLILLCLYTVWRT